MKNPDPIGLALDGWRLGVEAWAVIGLRVPRLLTGDAAAMIEAQRMVVEKIEAVGQLQWRAMTGTLGHTPHAAMSESVAHVRKAVRKNRKRLDRR